MEQWAIILLYIFDTETADNWRRPEALDFHLNTGDIC